MRTILAAALVLAGTAALADPLEGTWQTARDDNGNFGFVEVAPCGAALCGTLVQSFGPDNRPLAGSPQLGRRIIWDTVPQGGGEYRGRIYSPDRDQEYASRLVLTGDRLSVSGCVLGGTICREGGVWQRVQ